jgi:hypothetical protein
MPVISEQIGADEPFRMCKHIVAHSDPVFPSEIVIYVHVGNLLSDSFLSRREITCMIYMI